MAYKDIVYVGSASGAAVGSVTVGLSVSLTSLTGGVDTEAIEGDVVVVSVVDGATVDTQVSIATSGYTEVSALFADDTVNSNMTSSYKVMGVTPDTSVLSDPAGITTAALQVMVDVYRNVDNSTPIDVTTTTSTKINGTTIVPAPITPVTSGAWVVIHSGATRSSAQPDFSHGTLTENLSDPISIYYYACAYTGYYDSWTSGEFAPSAFTCTTSTSDSAVCTTMVLRPEEIVNAVKSINGLSNTS